MESNGDFLKAKLGAPDFGHFAVTVAPQSQEVPPTFYDFPILVKVFGTSHYL